jgi:hypothetical protein
MGQMTNGYKILVGKPMRRWEDNIKLDPGEIGLEDVDWTHVAQD